MPRDPDHTFQIQQPCPLSLDALEGDGPRRYCDQCQRQVHDLSALTRRQALRLRRRFQRRGERLCGIIRRHPDGRLHFQPDLRQRLTRRLRALPALAVLLAPGGCPDEPAAEAPEVEAAEVEAVEEPAEAVMSEEEMMVLLEAIGGYIE